MLARTFHKAITMDEADILQRLLRLLESMHVAYCVIGGQGVNAYVEPLVSLDLDVVIAADDAQRIIEALPEARVERFAHSVNVSVPGSDLRVQFQTDPRYAPFPPRSASKTVLGVSMQVAALEDILAGKVWAASDPARRPSKRQKDLADIARLIERYPQLRTNVPATILDRLL